MEEQEGEEAQEEEEGEEMQKEGEQEAGRWIGGGGREFSDSGGLYGYLTSFLSFI